MAKREARRKNPNYEQISGYVPVDLKARIKSECALRRVEISEAMEELFSEWIDRSHPKTSEEYDRLLSFAKAIALQEPIDGVAIAQLASDMNVEPRVLHEAVKNAGGKVVNGRT